MTLPSLHAASAVTSPPGRPPLPAERPGQAPPPGDLEPGNRPASPADPGEGPEAPPPGAEPRTEPDDEMAEPGFLTRHPGAAASPDADECRWRETFSRASYVPRGARFEDWAPAYRYGARAYVRHAPMGAWHEAVSRLGLGWEAARGESPLPWDDARHAAHEAWEQMKQQARCRP